MPLYYSAVMGVPVLNILFTVFQSIFQVFLLCLAGFALSFKGIVDKPTSKVLNHINVALFTPALLFSKVAYFLSPAKLRQLWVIPIFFVLLTGLSAVVAYGLARACRLKRSQVNFATAASMFMNSNSLPVALMQSLATTVPALKWGPDDTIDAMFGRSLTYLVVFSTLGMILRWSYGVRLLSQADEPDTPPPAAYRDVDEQHISLTHVVVNRSTAPLVDYETEPDIAPRVTHVRRTRPLRSRLAHPRLTPLSRRHTHFHVHSRLPAVPTSLGDQSESDAESDDPDTTEGDSEDTIALRPEPIDTGFSTETEDHATPPAPILSPRWDRPPRPPFFKRLLIMITSLSPPLSASLLALLCVLIPPAQQLLQSDEMMPFKGALDNAGACSVPVTLLVLGGWFWSGESQPSPTRADSKSASDGQGNAKSQGKAKNQSKGKGIAKHHAQHVVHLVDPQSSNSSTTSLTSLIGAFGDVLIGRICPRGGRRAGVVDTVDGHAADRDVEARPRLATHTETQIEHAENAWSNRPGSGSRPRSRTGSANGRAQSSPVSSTPTSLALSSTTPTRANPPGETLTVIVTLLARMVLVPLIVTPIMLLASRFGWGGEVFEDPVFIVSSMLLIASPPALTLAQISQRVKATKTTTVVSEDADAFSPFERLLSRTVFWAYLALTPPLTIVSVMVGLVLVEN